MHPRGTSDELLKELGGGNRAAGATFAHIANVGHLAVDQLAIVGQAVIGEHRQLPNRFAAVAPQSHDLIAPTLIVGHCAGHVVAERHDTRAGECRQIDNALRAAAHSHVEHVGQHESSFGVGVLHLDRATVAGL